MLFSFLQLALLALGLTAACVLFLNVKREMDVQARLNRVRWDDVLTQLRAGEEAAKAASTGIRPPMIAFSAMNQSTRMQAVRLLRRGEDVSHIAAAFGIPRKEVELLVRVHQLSGRRAAQASSLTTAVSTTETMLTISAPKNAEPNPST
jgi:Protein of unknown function (DUF2802)